MGKIRISDIFAYLAVSVIAVALAAVLSLQFLKSASSQEEEAPPTAEAPATVPAAPAEAEIPSKSSDFSGKGDDDLSEVAPQDDVTPRPTFPSYSANGTANSVREVEVFLEPFLYDARQRRDPFQPYKEPEQANSQPQGPLQMYSLEQLKLVGIMWDIKKPRAMFVDPSNEVHMASRDDGIGKKNGYIAAIREGEVVVVEAERTDKGINYETKVIRLPR
jgi:type IV pilus assembly protein PilP